MSYSEKNKFERFSKSDLENGKVIFEKIINDNAFFYDHEFTDLDKCCISIASGIKSIQRIYDELLRLKEHLTISDKPKEIIGYISKVSEMVGSIIKWERRYYYNLYRYFDEVVKSCDESIALEWHSYWSERLKDFYPHKIGFTEQGWFCLIIPQLLPKKTGKFTSTGGNDYLTYMLSKALYCFTANKYFKSYDEKCVLVYRYVYSGKTPKCHWRDYDNYEAMAVTNVIAEYWLTDDSPEYIELFNTVGITDDELPLTEVYLVPESQFSEFLSIIKSKDFKGFDLLETYSGLCEYPSDSSI